MIAGVISVGLAVALRLVFYPILGDHYPFFLFIVAIVLAAGYGGYGPSLLALTLSWLSVNYLFLVPRANPNIFESKTQLAIAFLSVGLVITVLGGSMRASRKRAQVSSSELRRAFEAQQAEREWLQITLASIADAVITTDPGGLVIFLNPVAARLTGWSLHEAVGHPLSEVLRTVQETSRRADDLPIAKVVDDGNIIVSDDEVVLIARDETARSVEHIAAPIRDSHGKVKGVVIVFRDITERHRAEQAQRESEERFRQLADNINDVFWIHELCGSRTAYVSPAYESLWGRPCESLYERPMSYIEAVHPGVPRERLQFVRRGHCGLIIGLKEATPSRANTESYVQEEQCVGSGTEASRSEMSQDESCGWRGSPRTSPSGSDPSRHFRRVRSGFAPWPMPPRS